MEATAYKCDMCGEPIKGAAYASEIFENAICADCGLAIRAAGAQLKRYGPRAGIGDMLRLPPKGPEGPPGIP